MTLDKRPIPGVWLPTLVAVISVCVATTTLATNFGSSGSVGTTGTTNGVFLANNEFHNIIERNLTGSYADGVTYTADTNMDTNTDLEAYSNPESSCVDLGWDVCVYDDNYGDNGLDGWNACTTGTDSGSHPDMVCSLDVARINTFYSPPPFEVACHELGHTVGLRHTTSTTSCMQSPLSVNDTTYNSHDVGHINSNY